jgi:hypothetical protein
MQVAAALGYCVRDADPSLGVRNRAPPGRSATWTEGEVVRLYKRAYREKARKVGTQSMTRAKSLKSGGSDGARTRDLRRDRPTLLAKGK